MADIPLDQYQEQTPFGLYSHAAETAAALPQAKGTPDQFKAMLLKQGVKPAEIEHSQYDDVFAGRPSVTKDELVQHFRQNMPNIKEHVLQRSPAKSSAARSLAESHGNDWDYMTPHRRQHYYDLVNEEMPEEYERTPKFESYSMPGGENYREVLLQLQRGEGSAERRAGDVYRRKSDLVAQYDRLPPGDPRGPEMSRQIVALQREYNQLLDQASAEQQTEFKAGHWDQGDVLAHLRMKDRTGPNGEKILHIDEIQSDWGQKGRGAGFQNPKANEEFEEYIKGLRQKLFEQNVQALVDNKVKEENRPPILAAIKKSIDETSPSQVAKYLGDEQLAEFEAKRNQLYKNATLPPHAPYVTNTAAWTDLALKRALHEAAKGGYDKMVITPGQEHADRYDLSNQIGEIEAEPLENGRVRLIAKDKESGDVVHSDKHDIDKIDDVIGKELADKVRQQVKWPEERNEFIIRNKQSGHTSDFAKTRELAEEFLKRFPESLQPHLEIVPRKFKTAGRGALLSGVDLKIGGEGMRHFYDRLVPKQLNEIVKRHDPQVKVGRDTLDTPEGPKDVHAIDITPKLRESILRGQKAFAEGGAVEDDGITAYHGSPHDFERFDLSKIGTGEGAQSYGHGLYFAEAEPVAKGYRDKLSQGTYKTSEGELFDPYTLEHLNVRVAGYKGIDEAIARANDLLERQPENADILRRDIARLEEAKQKQAMPHQGHMYEVNIKAHPDHFLDWDKPLKEQPHILQKLNDAMIGPYYDEEHLTGGDFFHALEKRLHPFKGRDRVRASSEIYAAGIPGIKYLDQGSRSTGEGSRNYVVFDDKLVNVKRKYARGGEVKEYPLAEDHQDHLTYMSPDEFLDRARPLKDTAENKETVSIFKKGMEKGHKLDPLALYPDNQENGRHRAVAAKQLGIKKVPVHDYRKGKKKGGVVDRALMVISCQPKGSGDAR